MFVHVLAVDPRGHVAAREQPVPSICPASQERTALHVGKDQNSKLEVVFLNMHNFHTITKSKSYHLNHC